MSNSKKEDTYIKKKKDMNFQSVDSMQSVVNVVNEAAVALNDKNRTIKESAIPEVLAGALGAGIGGVGSFAALYGLGVVGLSAAGITSGLATAGAIVGGGMVAGIVLLCLRKLQPQCSHLIFVVKQVMSSLATACSLR